MTFGENGCSGRSLRSMLSRVGGASNCLQVLVRTRRFIVTPQFPFTLMFLPEIYGLDLDVPIDSVVAITPVTIFFRKALKIELSQGGPAPIELVVHDELGLIQAIGRQDIILPGNRDLKAPIGGRRKRRRFARAFLAVWGTGFLYAAITGLQQDWRYRHDGIAVMAVYADPDQRLDQQTKMGVLTYQVAGVAYRLTSIEGIGLFNVGEQEKIYYLPADPQNGRQSGYLRFDLLGVVFGLIALLLSIFGGLIARIW